MPPGFWIIRNRFKFILTDSAAPTSEIEYSMLKVAGEN